MADNRTNELNRTETKSDQTFCFTEAQVEAAAKAYPRRIVDHDGPETPWEQESDALKNEYRAMMRAALVAAQGAAPQAADVATALRFCACSHWLEAHHDRKCLEHHCACVNFQPLLEVDEDALAEVISETTTMYNIWADMDDLMRESAKIARAVAEWFRSNTSKSA